MTETVHQVHSLNAVNSSCSEEFFGGQFNSCIKKWIEMQNRQIVVW